MGKFNEFIKKLFKRNNVLQITDGSNDQSKSKRESFLSDLSCNSLKNMSVDNIVIQILEERGLNAGFKDHPEGKTRIVKEFSKYFHTLYHGLQPEANTYSVKSMSDFLENALTSKTIEINDNEIVFSSKNRTARYTMDKYNGVTIDELDTMVHEKKSQMGYTVTDYVTKRRVTSRFDEYGLETDQSKVMINYHYDEMTKQMSRYDVYCAESIQRDINNLVEIYCQDYTLGYGNKGFVNSEDVRITGGNVPIIKQVNVSSQPDKLESSRSGVQSTLTLTEISEKIAESCKKSERFKKAAQARFPEMKFEDKEASVR